MSSNVTKSEIFVVWLGIRKVVSLLGWVLKSVHAGWFGKTFLNVKKHFPSVPTTAINNDCFLIFKFPKKLTQPYKDVPRTSRESTENSSQ